MGMLRTTFVVLTLASACAGDDTQEPARDASTSPDPLVFEAGGPAPGSAVAGERRDGGGGFRIPPIDLSKLDAEKLSRLEGVYYAKTINGYLIVCWEDGRVQIQTPRGETCSQNVGVHGRSSNVHVQIRSSPEDAVIEIHGVAVVRDGACVP